MTMLIALALAVIAGLAFYAGKLLFQLNKQTELQKLAQRQHHTALQQHDANILKSVALIVQALQEQQCDLSEGCWRICVLLDSLKTTTGLRDQFLAIYGLYNKVKEMAILGERKKLEKKQRMRDDYNRVMFEAEYQAAIIEDLKLLAEFSVVPEHLKQISH
ncbi:MAG: DUF2489 domain-containing protein [Alteromonadaceae bacterium]|nr:DUF2489 domain-containing protein [Alteromonadaceae bacterium]